MNYPILILSFAFVLLAGNAGAENIDDYLTLLDDHPSIQRVLQEKEALDFQADGALGLPDPILSLGVENIPIADPSFDQYLPSSKTIGFSQNIPNPAHRKAQKSVFNQSAQVQQIFAAYSRSRLHATFYTKLAELKSIDEQLQIEERKKLVIEDLRQFYQGEVLAGEPVFQKTFAVELELSEVEKRINDLHASKRVVEATCIQLVGEVPQLTVVQHQEKLWDGTMEHLYPVMVAEERVVVAEKRMDVVDAEFKPDFGIAATYKNREEGDDNSFEGDDWFSLQFRMTIPLWASSNQEPRLASAKSRKRGAVYDVEDVRRSWKMQMDNLATLKEASSNNITILTRKKQALEQSIDALKSTYVSGRTNLEPSLMAELNRLSILSRIVKERENYTRLLQEANGHIHIGTRP